MDLPKISIIIVTWNGLHHLKKYLPSVFQTDYSNFEVIIADNDSNDATVAWVEKNFPDCKIAKMENNFGYAGGNNRAVDLAEGEILLFLNNDVEVTPQWLRPVSTAFADPDTAIVQPKIRSAKNREMFEYAGAAGGFIDWLGYPFCRGRVFNTIEPDTGQYDDKIHIFWASGAAYAIRKDVFEDLGGFDTEFEFHMEEIDLCWRTLKNGHNIVFEPNSVVFHLGGGSMPADTPRKVFYNFRNSLLMLLKNLDRFVAPKIFTRLVLDGLSGVKFLFDGKPENTIAIFKAHFSFYKKFALTLKKRGHLAISNRQLMSRGLIHSKLIPIQYFWRQKKRYAQLRLMDK